MGRNRERRDLLRELRKLSPTLKPELLFSWEGQECQYEKTGPPGMSLFVPEDWVACLLYRDETGKLLGILNYYTRETPFEQRGNVNIWIHPEHQRQGIGTALLAEASRRWEIDFLQQRYSPAGLSLVRKFVERSWKQDE